MTEDQALETFAKYLTNTCPTCEKPPGELCNTGGVWIHLDRMTTSTAWTGRV